VKRPTRRRRVAALVLAALGLAWAGGATGANPPCGSPEECFRAFTQTQRNVQSVRARFRQVKEIALLREPLVSTGRFEFERDRGVRWEVESPEPMVIEINGDRLRAGAPGELRDVEVGSSAELLGELAGLFTGEAGADRFGISAGKTPGAIRLEPRDPSLARIVSAVELDVDAEAGAPRSVQIEEVGGDRTRIEMSDVEVERRPEAGSAP
jgi:outer membrane lipoprotein-sorting protein